MDNFRHSRFKSPWLPAFRRASEGEWPGQCVVCFPPAGAGAGFFREWPLRLPRHSLMPVQLPGREERFGETLSEDTKVMAVAIAGAISIPTRHLHQVIEMANKKDIEASIKLLQYCVEELNTYNWEFK